MALYRITNYGNTRKLPYKGEYYEIPKNGSIEKEDKNLADEFAKYMFVDSVLIEQPDVKVSKKT